MKRSTEVAAEDSAEDSDDEAEPKRCPRCGSVEVRQEFSHAALIGFLTIWPLLPVRQPWSCQKCGHTWKWFGW
jgi:transposase-like protein